MQETADLPQIFAQRTESNLRLCSLLSALLMRRTRDVFTPATEKRLFTSIEFPVAPPEKLKTSRAIVIVSCGIEAADELEFLESAILKSSYALVKVSHRENAEKSQDKEWFFEVLATMQPGCEIYIVALSIASVNFVYRTLSEFNLEGRAGMIKGIILGSLPDEWCAGMSIPTIMLSANVNKQANAGLLSQNNPSCIVVHRSGPGSTHTNALFYARLVFKYIYAVNIVYGTISAVKCNPQSIAASEGMVSERSRM